MKKKRILSAALALLLMASLPVTAFAAEWYLEDGSITVSADNSGQTVSQGGSAAVADAAPVITQRDSTTTTTNTVTIKADAGQTANVTLSGVNIDSGSAAVSSSGEGSVTIELDGTNTVKSGHNRAGLEKNNDGSLTITDADDNGSLTAQGGAYGAGIGGGERGNGSNITVSGDAQVKVQGGNKVGVYGTGAPIGNGGGYDGSVGAEVAPAVSELTPAGKIEYYAPGADMKTAEPTNITHGGEHEWDDGVETKAPTCSETGVKTYTCKLGDNVTKNEDISKLPHTPVIDEAVAPTYTHTGLTEGSHCSVCNEVLEAQEIVPMLEKSAEAPLYRVKDADGRGVNYKAERKDGVLTVTVDADFAVLTGTLNGISTLRAQGVEKLVFVTKSAKSTFALADLLKKGSADETYKLTHNGRTVTFTLGVNNTDVSDILEKA